MPRIVETTVYELRELSEAAKEKARSWYREHGLFDEWYDFVFEDFQAICGLLGIDLETRPVRLYGGGTREDPCIFFRGFWSQGDGASFSGTYGYKPDAARAIRGHAPEDATLHAIADRLQDLQRRNFYQLTAGISRQGRYCHEYTMSITMDRDSPTGQDMTADAEDAVTEAMRGLARWLYRQLELEYESQTSDEAADEAIQCNEWTFTDSGKRFG